MRKRKDNPVERRSEVRLISCISARIWALGVPTQAYTKDISASGIRFTVETPCRFEVGERYRVEIDLPREDRTVHTYARVIRIDEEPGSSGKWKMALHYDTIHPDDQTRIRRFVFRRSIERRQLGLA